jgi:hypothetical protein
MRAGRAAEVAVLLILAFGVWLGFAGAGLPPVPRGNETQSSGTFSTSLAMQSLRTIASAPHPVGTPAHDRVRDYLVDRLRAFGCDDVHVQSATGFNMLDGPIAATIANVVCRKPGRHSGGAVLLTAHYDAVPRSFGAGDDGVGVAAILETLRALTNGPPLANDLIILFSDAEEEGLLGSEAFVDLHPWARDVAAVLNFDNRGDAGPVFMFQTSPGNARLIDMLADAVPHARTNSLTGEVYRHLPSDTDLSIWLHSAYAVGALNFAAVGGYTHYHTPTDDLASLDPRVLQHAGDYAVGMARALGNADLAAMRSHDATYFTVPWLGVVHYPASLALPLGVLGLLAVVALVVVAGQRRIVSWRGVGRGFGLVGLTLVVPPAVAFIGWRIISALHPRYAEILQGDPYNSLWYLLAFVAFTVAVAVELHRRFAIRATVLELSIAPLVLWSVLGVAVAFMLPGASYLFIWPLLAAALTSMLLIRPGLTAEWPAAVLAIPALVIWPPLIKSFEVALTASTLHLWALLTAILLSLLVVPIHALGRLRRCVAIAAILVGVGALIRAESMAGFTATRKRPDSLSYLIDADSATAWWMSFDRTPDVWTAQALGPRPDRRAFDDFHLAPGRSFLASAGQHVVVDSTSVQVLQQDAVAGGQRIHLHIRRSGASEEVALYTDRSSAVSDVTVNGRVLADGTGDRYAPRYHVGRHGAVLRYFGVPEDGVDLWFTLRSAGPVTLHVVTTIEGLPDRELPGRPAWLMSKPFVPTDVTIIAETLKL